MTSDWVRRRREEREDEYRKWRDTPLPDTGPDIRDWSESSSGYHLTGITNTGEHEVYPLQDTLAEAVVNAHAFHAHNPQFKEIVVEQDGVEKYSTRPLDENGKV